MRSRFTGAFFFAGAAAFLVAASFGERARHTISESRPLLGTYVTITVAAQDDATAKAHLGAAFDRIEALEQTLSARRPDSELSLALKKAKREPARVSDDLYRALAAGVAWHDRSGGAFDITVAPLLNLWRACGKEKRLPTTEELERARGLLGADAILLNDDDRTIRLLKQSVAVDLGGLGKGFCADEVRELLEERGARSALIAVAGDIYALGRKPDGTPWRVGVQDPRDPNNPHSLLTVLLLSDQAISTSGNYQRYVEIGGRRYSHIVDPRTGLTAEDAPSVTVVGPDTLTTDVLGTTLSVLGVQDGLATVEAMPGVEALFVTFDDADRPTLVRSSGFAAYEAGTGSRTDYRK
jgi:thiamine biosynthesis lipoprotein